MKFTIAEAAVILSKQLELDVEIVSDSEAGDWIINTETTEGHPDTLKANDRVEVEYFSGVSGRGIAGRWGYSWNTNNLNHIVKYRKVN